MKKIFIIITLAVFLTSCYDEFRNDYPYTTVAFSTVTGGLSTAGELGRTVVKGEGLKLDIGVYFAGVLENKEERWVKYTIDPTLLAGTAYTLLPADYYTLSNANTFVIPKGEFAGKVTITLDSIKFLNDPKAVSYSYAIPVRLTETSADSILSSQSTKIVVIKYINRQEGYYNHTGTYHTFDAVGTEISNGTIENVLQGTTVSHDSVNTDGLIYNMGEGYNMHLKINSDNTVTWWKLPNPPIDYTPKNVAGAPTILTTDYCSSWETLEAVRDGSIDPADGKFGNWPSSNDWGWLQYDFARYYKVDSVKVYWYTDGGGLLMPTEIRVDYWNYETKSFSEVPNPVGYGNLPDQWNSTTFDQVITNKIRLNFINSAESVGVLEFVVWGVPASIFPEQTPIATVVPDGPNTYDPASSTFTLNYKVTYENETYYSNVSTKMVWRNRIRDGVNEWRR